MRRGAKVDCDGRLYTRQVDERALRIGPARVDLAELVTLVTAGDAGKDVGHGAVVTFLGTVRAQNQGRRVLRLEYEAFEPLALKTFATIRDEAQERWPSARVAFHHRVGSLALGEASVGDRRLVAASRRGFRRLPLRHRADQADRSRVEARVLRRGRRLDRGGDGRSVRRGRARGGVPPGMRVTVRLFGRLHDLAGANEFVRDVPAGATVGDVWRQLAGEFPSIEAYSRSISAAVNADFARMTAPVSDGDEVAFLPPVSGG